MTIKIRILAIFGETHDIDLTEHKNALESLPGVEVVDLKNKKLQEITNKLRYEKWSVVFFAGHSQTNLDDDNPTGLMQINQDDKITIDNLKLALRRATENGLKLAIFNSCDGTGLARKALEFGVPRIIVFREQVPNKVAAEFVKYFFQEFQTRPLHLALREAREGLEGLQDRFPCATWLPILFKNSITPTLTWEMLGMEIPDTPAPTPIKINIFSKIIYFLKNSKKALLFTFLVVIAILVAIFVIPDVKKILFPQIKYTSPCENLTGKDVQLSCGDQYLIFKDPNSPDNIEKLIYDMNSNIKKNFPAQKIRTVVVTAPYNESQLQETSFIAKAILEGAWERIKKFNDSHQQMKLLVLVVKEGSEDKDVQKIADKLKDYRQNIIAIIGCYASKATWHLQKTLKNRQTNIVVISGHTTAERNADQKLENSDYFFRITTSTDFTASKLVKHIQQKGINKVAVLAGPDLFAKSFNDSFIKSSFKESLKIVTLDYNLISDDSTDETLKTELLDKAKKNDAKGLMLCVRAFNKDDKNSKQNDSKMARRLIQLNKGELLIAGCNSLISLYNQEEFKRLLNGDNNNQIKKNLIVAVPWYPEEKKESDTDLMRYGLSYDATHLLTEAIEQWINKPDNKGKIPTTEDIKTILSNPFSTKEKGKTGTITIKNNEREEKQETIVQPECDEKFCRWTKID